MSRTKNVFISHVHEDDAEVGNLKSLLKQKGYKIRDSSIISTKPNEAKSKDYIKSGILAPRIKWAGTMIVLVSPDTHKSIWVDWEAEYAQKTDTRIVGVWTHGAKEADLPKSLDQYADAMVGWNADTIVDAVNGKINNWTGSDGKVHDRRDIPHYSC